MDLEEYIKLPDTFKIVVYDKYMEHDGDPELALSFVDKFLDSYPFYPEALLFKARMLIALRRDREALIYLEQCKKFEKWRIVYEYDLAEILFNMGQKSDAIKLLKSHVEISLRDVLEGIENFLLGLSFDMDGMNQIRDIIKGEMILYLSKESNSVSFDMVTQSLNEHKTNLED